MYISPPGGMDFLNSLTQSIIVLRFYATATCTATLRLPAVYSN